MNKQINFNTVTQSSIYHAIETDNVSCLFSNDNEFSIPLESAEYVYDYIKANCMPIVTNYSHYVRQYKILEILELVKLHSDNDTKSLQLYLENITNKIDNDYNLRLISILV